MADTNCDRPPVEYLLPNERKRRREMRGVILERDRGLCQCCGANYQSSRLEVHHIHPHRLGGLCDSSNLITLCSDCHRFAPSDPDEFLMYQKVGGARQAVKTVYILHSLAESQPGATIKDFLDAIVLLRVNAFDKMKDSDDLTTSDALPEIPVSMDSEQLDQILELMDLDASANQGYSIGDRVRCLMKVNTGAGLARFQVFL